MKKLLLTTLLGSVVLTGCCDAMHPKCDSKDTKKLLTQIITQQGRGQISYVGISDQLTLNEDKEGKRYLCQANVSLASMGGASFPVQYSVFWDKVNKDKFFVQVIN